MVGVTGVTIECYKHVLQTVHINVPAPLCYVEQPFLPYARMPLAFYNHSEKVALIDAQWPFKRHLFICMVPACLLRFSCL